MASAYGKYGNGGSVLVEAVLALPVLFLFIVGILQFSHIWMARQMTAYAAYAAARATMVVQPGEEQQDAAENAARMVLSWISLADHGDGDETESKVTVPGWGKVLGSGSVLREWNSKGRVNVAVSNIVGAVRAEVRFRFPLMMPLMSVWNPDADSHASVDGLILANGGASGTIDGWRHIELRADCELPMPYSTAHLPSNAFYGAGLHE